MSSILLLKVSGDDRPGLTAELTSTLAHFGVVLLDLGQSVIHDQVSLEMLLQLPDEANAPAAIREVMSKARELGISAHFSSVEASAYSDWIEQQGRDRYVLTLLARRITAQHLARVSSVVSEQGLNIQNITRLTGRIALDAPVDSGKACVELNLLGQPQNPDQLHLAFLDISRQLDIDIAFQQDTVYRRNRRLVCFDMDSTLIEAEVIDELAKEAGVGDQVAAITERAMTGELDFQQSFRQRMTLLKGLDESVLADVAARLPITEGAQRLIGTLHAYGFKTAIISGGFSYFGHYLQQQLGIDYVYANELEIAGGKVTGNVKGTIIDGERKATLLRELADREGIKLEQTIAIGDGANDLPMLSQAGLGIAFRAKPIVRQSARHAITTLGLDAVLYLLGFRDEDIH